MYTVLDRNAVPIAAGILGWLFGARFMLRVLNGLALDSHFCLTRADSSHFVYSVQTIGAVISFIVTKQYLN